MVKLCMRCTVEFVSVIVYRILIILYIHSKYLIYSQILCKMNISNSNWKNNCGMVNRLLYSKQTKD